MPASATNVSILFTWRAALMAAAGDTQFALLGSSDMQWHSTNQVSDQTLQEVYNRAEAQIVIDMPWQCDSSAGDVAGLVLTKSGVHFTLKPDPALMAIAWTSMQSGTAQDLFDVGFVSDESEYQSVLVNFVWSPARCSFEQASSAVFSPSVLTTRDVTLNFLGFQDFQNSTNMLAVIKTIGPVPNLEVVNCAFHGGQVAVRSETVDSSDSGTLRIEKSAFYKVHYAVLITDSIKIMTVDGSLFLEDGDPALFLPTLTLPYVVQVEQAETVSITSSTFKNLGYQYVLHLRLIGEATLNSVAFERCGYADTTLSPSYAMHVSEVLAYSTINIQECTFQDNLGGGLSVAGSTGMLGTLQITDSVFKNSTSYAQDKSGLSAKGGGALSIEQIANVYIDSSIFESNVAVDSGGAVFISRVSQVQLRSSNQFAGNRALQGNGGDLFVRDAIMVQIYDSSFSDSTALQGSGGSMYFTLVYQQVSIDTVSFSGCRAALSGGCIVLSSVRGSDIVDTTVQSSYAGQKGGFILISKSFAEIDGLQITNATAQKGGVVATEDHPSGVLLQSTTITESVATVSGGILYMESDTIFVLNGLDITNTQAPFGAVATLASYHRTPWFQLQRDESTIYGYELYSMLQQRSMFTNRYYAIESVNIVNATAQRYGTVFMCRDAECPPFASSSQEISISPAPKQGTTINTDPRYVLITEVCPNSPNISQPPVCVDGNRTASVHPGQTFSISAQAYDTYGQRISYYPDFAATLEMLDGQNVQLVPAIQQAFLQEKDGRFFWSGLQVIGHSGSALTLKISMTTSASAISIVATTLKVGVSNCPLGYAEVAKGCDLCSGPTKFSITTGAKECSLCPSNAACGGDSIQALAGYYLVISNSTSAASMDAGMASPLVSIYQCPNPEFCQRGNTCSGNRDGPLCNACRAGYSEWEGRCLKCDETNGGLVFVWIIYLLFMFLVQHVGSQSPKSGSMKILFFFTQIFLLVIGPLQSNLLGWARGLFSFEILLSPSAGSAAEAVCPFPRSSMSRMIGNLFQPLAFVFMVAVLFVPTQAVHLVIIVMKKIARRGATDAQRSGEQAVAEPGQSSPSSPQVDIELQDTSKSKISIMQMAAKKKPLIIATLKHKLFKFTFGLSTWIRSLLNMLILSFTVLSTASFQYFNCRMIGNKRVIISATDIECYSQEYQAFEWLFILGTIYVCCLPLLFFIILTALRIFNKLENKHAKRFIGSLYLSYRSHCWWYECWNMLRRLILVIFVVFLGSSPDVLQPVLLAFLLLMLVVQLFLRPYRLWMENLAEEVALAALILMVSLNQFSSYSSSSSSTSGSAAAAVAGVSLAVFLLTVGVVLVALVSNHWLTKLLLPQLRTRAKQIKIKMSRADMEDDQEDTNLQVQDPVSAQLAAMLESVPTKRSVSQQQAAQKSTESVVSPPPPSSSTDLQQQASGILSQLETTKKYT